MNHDPFTNPAEQFQKDLDAKYGNNDTSSLFINGLLICFLAPVLAPIGILYMIVSVIAGLSSKH